MAGFTKLLVRGLRARRLAAGGCLEKEASGLQWVARLCAFCAGGGHMGSRHQRVVRDCRSRCYNIEDPNLPSIMTTTFVVRYHETVAAGLLFLRTTVSGKPRSRAEGRPSLGDLTALTASTGFRFV